MIFFGPASLQHAFMAHYHTERNRNQLLNDDAGRDRDSSHVLILPLRD